jgi:hypothetical protein
VPGSRSIKCSLLRGSYRTGVFLRVRRPVRIRGSGAIADQRFAVLLMPRQQGWFGDRAKVRLFYFESEQGPPFLLKDARSKRRPLCCAIHRWRGHEPIKQTRTTPCAARLQRFCYKIERTLSEIYPRNARPHDASSLSQPSRLAGDHLVARLKQPLPPRHDSLHRFRRICEGGSGCSGSLRRSDIDFEFETLQLRGHNRATIFVW